MLSARLQSRSMNASEPKHGCARLPVEPCAPKVAPLVLSPSALKNQHAQAEQRGHIAVLDPACVAGKGTQQDKTQRVDPTCQQQPAQPPANGKWQQMATRAGRPFSVRAIDPPAQSPTAALQIKPRHQICGSHLHDCTLPQHWLAIASAAGPVQAVGG